MASLVDQYSKEELELIVKNSHSIKEVIDKLGYTTHNGNNNITIKNKLKFYNIDYSHFNTNVDNRVVRNEENIFIENSTASQSTLRRWYKNGNYTDYKCSICGQEPIWQGKELTLILDHINGSNHDDRLENLRWVCPNCNQQLPTTGFRKSQKLQKKNYCIDCGQEISLCATRCMSCEAQRRTNESVMYLTRDELKDKIRILPFTTIGAEYGVSDNSVRKWCDKYNLPRTKKEINSYSNEEWEQI